MNIRNFTMESLYNKTQPFIHDYFTVVDLIKMRRVCKFFRRMGLAKIFRKRLIGNISRICEVNFAEATQLLKNIDDCNCIISGSIILQTLYSEEFKGSDIDIYYNRDANAKKKDEQAKHIIQHVLELKEKPLRKLVMGFHYDGILWGHARSVLIGIMHLIICHIILQNVFVMNVSP